MNKNQFDTIVSTEKSYEQLYLERAKIDEDVLIKYFSKRVTSTGRGLGL